MPTVTESRPAVSEINVERPDQFPGRWLALAAIVIGIALRIWQYAANPSIWVDEASIARNVLDRQPSQLFGPLDYGQIAPPGFLLGIKLSVTLLGFSEYALRLVPFVAGIASPALFFLVARSLLRPVETIVATLMFSVAIPLVFFSSNLKQYSSDVAVTLVVIGMALRFRRSLLTRRSAYGFALVSVPLLFCSQAAVFPLTAAGAVVFTEAFVARRLDRWYRLAVVASWAAALVATVAYGSWMMTSVDNVYFNRFWEQAFMPREGAIGWLWTTARNVFAGPPGPGAFDGSLHYPWPGLFTALVVIGTVAMCVDNPATGALVAGPVVLTVAAAAVRAYPLGTRVSLFLLPLLLLLVVAGAEYTGRVLVRRRHGKYVSALLLPLAIATFLQEPPPRTPEHLRPVMQYVSDNWKVGDALWVYYGAGQAFHYYVRRWPIKGDIRIGDCDRTDPRNYLRQVDVERGRPRVWVLMSHDSGAFRFDERKLLTDYLDTIGRRIGEFHAPAGDNSSGRAAVFLYDLSSLEKLASSSADRFEVRNNYPPQTWTCYGTMSSLGPDERVVAAVMREEIK